MATPRSKTKTAPAPATTKKKMPPLPEGASQRSEPVRATPLTRKIPHDDGLAGKVRAQRLRARQRAELLKGQLRDQTPEQLLASLSTAATEMHAATQEVGSAGKELAETMNQIATTARQMSASTAESLAGIKQVLQGSRVSQERTQESLRRVRNIEGLVNTMTEGVAVLISDINAARDANAVSSSNVGEVQSQSSAIREIVRSVSVVADQINLYAFNAALEASRAGRHGSGFSIVSDEVRLLAQRATAAAANIESVLGDVEEAISSVVEDLITMGQESEAFAAEANASMQGVAEARSAIATVSEASGVIDERARQLIASMERLEQSAAVIARSTEGSQTASTESAAVLTEQSNALRGIQEAAEELTLKAEQARDGDLRDAALEETSTIADELSATIQEAAAAANQIGAAVRQIARETDVIAEQAESNMPAVEQAKAHIVELGDRTRDTEEEVVKLQEALGSSGTKLSSVLANVATSAERNVVSARKIRKLQGEVLRIDEVIDALVAISIMTSLLSVSGRIEGVRAGEAGEGFITVSEDIRRLAEDTSNNVTTVRRLVRGVQLSIATLATDLEGAGVLVRNSASKLSNLSALLNTIEADIGEITTGTKVIAKGAADAAAGVPQVSSAIRGIADAAAQAATATAQASSAAAEQAQAMVELANTVDDMAMQTTLLRK